MTDRQLGDVRLDGTGVSARIGLSFVASESGVDRKYMPSDISGKYVLTNTTTKSDVETLQKRA